ncbi:hypothetical protein [Streptomyces fragilis]|uniref:Uncharacterized protein n=1 Tax=Streptomyces fragilis TaxID=67301 RepID=A0ABV2YN15_9ACTN|nr:hypothetical protein [Streptomyces fragilis]
MPSSPATGPWTTTISVHGWVVVREPYRLKSGCRIATTATSSTGTYAGRQPAITALAASPRRVSSAPRGATGPSKASGCRVAAARKRSTRSGVGTTTGRPSVHPRPCSCSEAASSSRAPPRRRGPVPLRSLDAATRAHVLATLASIAPGAAKEPAQAEPAQREPA